MKINQTALALQSEHASESMRSRSNHLRAWVGGQRPAAPPGAQVSISARAMAMELSARSRSMTTADAAAVSSENPAVTQEPRLLLLAQMVEEMTGLAVKVFNAADLQAGGGASSAQVQPPPQPPSAAGADTPPMSQGPQGWGIESETRTVVAEYELMRFSAQGVIRTADGQEIQFNLELEMSRSFVQETRETIRMGDAVLRDPLVINFEGNGVQLSDTRFDFDLNADGQTERIASLKGGSGFLVLDRNADGQVNNGAELFGTRSGDGFADLAALDADGNQWIDESDPAFQQLQVWRPGAAEGKGLMSLQQAGVGALYLGRVATPFTVKPDMQTTLGQVRSTGLYLSVAGEAGTLQQVDL